MSYTYFASGRSKYSVITAHRSIRYPKQTQILDSSKFVILIQSKLAIVFTSSPISLNRLWKTGGWSRLSMIFSNAF